METKACNSEQSLDTESSRGFEEQRLSDQFKVHTEVENAKIAKDGKAGNLVLTEPDGMTQYDDGGIHLRIKYEALLKSGEFEEASKMSGREEAKIAKMRKLRNLNLTDTDGRTQLDDGGKYLRRNFDSLLDDGKLDKAVKMIPKPKEEYIGYDMTEAAWNLLGPEYPTKAASKFWSMPGRLDYFQEFKELTINDRMVNNRPTLSKTIITDEKKNVINSRKQEHGEEDESTNTDRPEEVSIWCSRFQSGTHVWVKQRNNLLGFRMDQTCSVIKQLVHLWTMTRQNSNDMMEVLDECTSEMMTVMKKDYENYIKQYYERKNPSDKLGEALKEFGALGTIVHRSECEIKKPQDKKCSNEENRDADVPNDSHSLRRPILDEELTLMMNSPIVHEALNLGLTEGKIRRALQRKIQQTGAPFLSMEALAEAVLGRDREYDSDSDITNDDYYENNYEQCLH